MDQSIQILNITNWLAQIGLLSLLLIPILLYLYSSYQFSYYKRKGLNGPPALPFIGNFLSPKRPIALLQIDYFKKYGKFFGMYQGRKPVLSISDPVIIRRILIQDFNIFRNRLRQARRHKIMSQNLVAVRDEKWKRIRSILSPMFTTSKLKKMEDLMCQCVDSMLVALDKMSNEQRPILAHGVMGNFTMDVIAKCAFATDTDAHNENDNAFVKNARGIFSFNLIKALLILATPDFIQRFLGKFKIPPFHTAEIDFFINITSHLIKQRKSIQNGQQQKQFDDMFQLMIKAEHGKEKRVEQEDLLEAHHVNVGHDEIEQEEKIFKEIIGSKYLDEEEIIAQSIVFFLAGYETTASTLTFCLYELAQNPQIQQKLYEEIKQLIEQGLELDYNNIQKLPYLDAVLSETLRKHPPALALSREAAEEYHIPEYNYTMEKGEGILIPIYAIHHNPDYFKNPENFIPERFLPENRDQIIPYTYLPFGGGPRNCIGMRFALSEAKLGLAKIITNYLICKSNKTPSIEIQKSLFILKTNPIYIEIKKRQQ